MTKLKDAVAGDRGDTRVVVLNGVASLTGITSLEAHVWRKDVAPVTLSASVLDPVACTITINLGLDPSTGWLNAVATPGTYKIEYEAVFGTTTLTWPAGDPDTITVRAGGD